MNMYRHELWAHRKSTLLWSISLAGVVCLMLAMFPTISKDAETFKEMLTTMPEAALKAMGLQIDSITSLLGYYSYVFMYIALCGAIQAMHLGASIVSKETREKTADFLLSKPVDRGAILTSKTLAALTLLLITNVIYFGIASVIATIVQTTSYNFGTFTLLSLTLLFTQLIFLALGIAAALLFPKLKTVLPLSLGTVFAFFMISAIGASSGDSKLKYLSPFQYFDRTYIIEHSGYEATFLIVSAGVIISCITFSYFRYLRRDVHVS
ncbi:ABC transporter permease subunit [Paenibacillus sp. GSMTC-2017]|uniref:ABC transporter permease subunit n=1 Tax=Paenibacillus sp. GSMTC-2017 TaxID=2794350 RepID=UPI0018D7BF97|nr:ABC transporter permease subunit [Paenibacillus sp. GSMTC-2017]MBH5319729.1 ABC transporter permease subunit [Paenibacillus sp. GSMTC-2017]